MIARLVGAFIAIFVGVLVVGPIADEISIATVSSSSWSTKALTVVPGIFILAILGIAAAVLLGCFKDADIF